MEMKKAAGIQILTVGLTTWGLGIMNASKLAAEATGFSPETVRRWASGYFTSLREYGNVADDITYKDIEQVLCSNRGHTASPCASLILDEKFQMSAHEFVHENAYYRGQPNVTALQFSEWVKLHMNVSIHEETARRWLHRLGFSHKSHLKGVYFDGHKREDVVQSRQTF